MECDLSSGYEWKEDGDAEKGWRLKERFSDEGAKRRAEANFNIGSGDDAQRAMSSKV
jgi:hypothetical protein